MKFNLSKTISSIIRKKREKELDRLLKEREHPAVSYIIKWYEGFKCGPYKMEIWPTYRCNLKCLYCGCGQGTIAQNDLKDEISDQDLKLLIQDAFEIGIKSIRFSGGGEPLIRHKIILPLMRKIKSFSPQLRGELTTNGILLNERIIEDLVAIGWDEIDISLDSPIPEVQDFLSGKDGVFKQILNNLNFIAHYKQKYGKQLPRVRILTVLTRKNFSTLMELIKLASQNLVSAVWFQPLRPDTKFFNELELDPDQKNEVMAKMEEIDLLAKELNVETNIRSLSLFAIEKTDKTDEILLNEAIEEMKSFPIPFFANPCFEPWLMLLVEATGKVGFCGPSRDTLNLKLDKRRLKDIWFGEEFNKLRDLMVKNKILPFCGKCCFNQVHSSKELKEALREKASELYGYGADNR